MTHISDPHERRYQALVENAYDVTFLVSAEGLVTFDTPAVERVLGYRPGELVGQPIFRFVHPDDLAHVQEVFGGILANPGQRYSLELRALHAAGHWVWVEAAGANLLHEPAVAAVVGNMRDISERKRADEMERARVLDLARERERIARDLHDGVMQSLYGVALALGATKRDSEGVSVQVIEHAMSQVSEVIADIRTYIYQLQPSPSEPSPIRQALARLADAVFAGSELRCALDFSRAPSLALPPAVQQEVLLVVREALSNVRRHAQALHVRLRAIDLGDYLAIVVADDGRGFDPAADDLDGSGLRNMAERAAALGGSLTVSSQPGAGAVLRLEVPRPPVA